MQYRDYALQEFRAAGWIDEDGNYDCGMQQAMCEHVLKLLEVFGEEGHSGLSAPYAANVFCKLALFAPLTPLTGEDWEWVDVSEDLLQNKRCSHVFKNKKTGEYYDINGKIFRDKSGCCYINYDSRVPVTFPYEPKSEYVDVDE